MSRKMAAPAIGLEDGIWREVLIATLVLNGLGSLAYRVYRLSRGGPWGDVIGQGLLACLLLVLAIALGAGAGWPKWPALAYGVLFSMVVMPLWTLAVLIPLRPSPIDYGFTALYWGSLAVIVGAALSL